MLTMCGYAALAALAGMSPLVAMAWGSDVLRAGTLLPWTTPPFAYRLRGPSYKCTRCGQTIQWSVR